MSHSHTDEKLVRMANQIATFFLSQPAAIRAEGVATHINKGTAAGESLSEPSVPEQTA